MAQIAREELEVAFQGLIQNLNIDVVDTSEPYVESLAIAAAGSKEMKFTEYFNGRPAQFVRIWSNKDATLTFRTIGKPLKTFPGGMKANRVYKFMSQSLDYMKFTTVAACTLNVIAGPGNIGDIGEVADEVESISPSSEKYGNKTILATATRVLAATDTDLKTVLIISKDTNTENIHLGFDSSVTTTTGAPIPPAGSITMNISDGDSLYAICASGGMTLYYLVLA